MAISQWRTRTGVEAALALLTGTGWFAISALVLGTARLDGTLALLALILVDVLVVLSLAHYWGIGFAVTAGVASVVAIDWYFIPPIHTTIVPNRENAAALAAYLVTGTLLGELAATTRRRAEASEMARGALADEQAALRRVATLVALGTAPEHVFASVTEEVGRLMGVDIATLMRYESDGTATVVAAWSSREHHIPVGSRLPLDGDNVAALVLQTGEPARMDSYAGSSGALAESLRHVGVRSSAGSPVVVAGRLWGVMITSSSGKPVAEGLELRLGEFTDLAATAVANAEYRDELTASRARIVASSDEARRRIERDIHDGLQQRLVALALHARGAEDRTKNVDQDLDDLGPRLTVIREGLVDAIDELRELSQGIHPAILTDGGLRPALAKLARRSQLPVELDILGPDRLPEPVEVCVYYVVSEALTNVAKHAHATHVHVEFDATESAGRLTIRDDGDGGVDARTGSGLVGLADRVHASGGSIEVTSPIGEGTTIDVRLPLTSAAARRQQ